MKSRIRIPSDQMDGKHAAPFWSAGIVSLSDLYVASSLETTAVISFSMSSVLIASALVSFVAPYMNRYLLFTPGSCCCCCYRPTPPACSCGGVRQPSFSREALPGVSST